MVRWLAQRWQDFRDWVHHALPYLIITGLLIVFIIIFEWHRMVVVIHSGQVGVQYKMFEGGTITDYVYPEGIHFLWPWNTMYVYNTQVQETERHFEVLTRDGLAVQVDLSIRYHPEPTMVGVLQQQIGQDYAAKIVVPEVESAVRTSIGKLNIEQLYSGLLQSSATAPKAATGPLASPLAHVAPVEASTPQSAPELAPADTSGPQGTPDTSLAAAFEIAADQAAKQYVVIDKVIVTHIKLPPAIESAIEVKMTAAENAETANYRIVLSQKEIEIANNQKQANDIVRSSLDDRLLRLKMIQALEDLSKSPNSKIVVIPNDRNSTPLILGSEK